MVGDAADFSVEIQIPPKSRCESWETCSRFHQDGIPESIASSICFLSVVSRLAPVFQDIVLFVVLDLLLFGWIELFSLFQ